MAKYLLFLSTLAFSASTLAQEKAQIENPKFIEEFRQLPIEQQKQLHKDGRRATQLYEQKKIKECLTLVEVIKKLTPSNPGNHNLEGACHVENKDYQKATASFQKVLLHAPGNLNASFNLAEVEFVTKKFRGARTQFEKVRQGYLKKGKMVAEMEALCRYKIFLCHLMLKEKVQAQKIATSFENEDPQKTGHFYCQVALSLNAKDLKTAAEWQKKYKAIAPKINQSSFFEDSLIELGLMKKTVK